MAEQVGVYAYPNNPYVTKPVYEGFSWTTFFFGFWPAALRADVRGAVAGFVIPIGTIFGLLMAVLIFELLPSSAYPPVWFLAG